MTTSRIAIVGGGPAGLVAALALRRLGVGAEIFEQAPDFRAAGGGIVLQPNGLRVLDALGILDSLVPKIVPCTEVQFESASGRRLMTSDYCSLPGPHNQLALLLRLDLQKHLADAAAREGIEVNFGSRCVGAKIVNSRARLCFSNGREDDFDAVLACDGINSRVRDSFSFGVHRSDSRHAALRGVAERPCKVLRESWGGGRFFGTGPLAHGRTYFYCTAPLSRWGEIKAGGMSSWIESWREFGHEVRETLEAVTDWDRVSYDEIKQVRVNRWHLGPIFLVGDAAHAMAPSMGQGANCAMVDSLILTQTLATAFRENGSLEEVGKHYELLRGKFVTRIQSMASQMLWASSLKFPPGPQIRDAIFSVVGKVGFLSRRGILIAAGYNSAEEPYLDQKLRS